MTTFDTADNGARCLSGQCGPNGHEQPAAQPLRGPHGGGDAPDEAGAARRRAARTAERRRAARISALAAGYRGSVA